MNPTQLLTHFDRLAEAPDAIPRLRRFILDLAVRGKLVGQDHNDEAAADLLKRIQAEKARLVKKGEIKRLDSFDPVETNEIPFSIPAGWEVVRMGWLARKLGAGSTPLGGKSVYQTQGVPFLRSQNVHNDGLRLDDVALIARTIHDRMSGTHVQRQDILLNITGASIGRCALVPDTFAEGNVSQHVAIVRLFLPAIREFIHLSLISPFFQKVIDDVQVGVSREGLSMQRLKLFPMLIPPLPEQHCIVAKVDELMALCDRLEAAQMERGRRRDRLAAASLNRLNRPDDDGRAFRAYACFHLGHLPRFTVRPDQIPALRQTILNLAVRGRLVRQDPNDQTATDLLNRIQTRKAKLINEAGIKKDKVLWDGLPTEPPHALPPNWKWTRLQDLFEISRGGSPRPAGDPRYFGGTIPWITVGEITKDGAKFLTVTEGGLTEEGAKRSRFVDPGDLLLTNSGATLGVPKISRIRGCMNDGVAVLRLFHSVPLNDFVYLYLQAQTEIFRKVNQGMGQPNLNTPIIAGWFCPLPPLDEQRRIVAKVDELLAVCDRLESQLAAAQTESRRLLEAVLHEALAPG